MRKARAVTFSVMLFGHTLAIAQAPLEGMFSQTVSPFEARLRQIFLGQNISAAVKRLGAAGDRKGLQHGAVVYFWRSSGDSQATDSSASANSDRSFSCEISLWTDAHGFITFESVKDKNDGCHLLFGPKLD